MVVNQWVPAAHRGDAIGDSARAVRNLLRAQGHEADIYALTIDENMRGDARPFADPAASTGDVTILHFAIPSPMTEAFADQQGPIPLNVQLKTYANQGTYDITLTHHEPMAMGNPETAQPFGIPWRYLARHTLNGQAERNCSGTAEVESPGNFPHIVFANVPDDELAYDGSQRVLSGEHSWTEGASELDVSGMETPGCSDKRALRNFNRSLPADSVTKTLKWTLRRLGGPSGP
jgi:hypothetical protein